VREGFLSGSAFSNLLTPLESDSLTPFDPSYSAEFGQGDRDGPFYLEGEYTHCISAAALESSASPGCHLCSLLWHSVPIGPTHHIGLYLLRNFKISKEEMNGTARNQLHFVAAGLPDPPLVVKRGHRRSIHSTECGVISLYAGRVRNSPIPKLRGALKALKSAKMYEICRFYLRDSPDGCSLIQDIVTGRLKEPNFIRNSVSTTDSVFGMA
jgi:hypothetical protein